MLTVDTAAKFFFDRARVQSAVDAGTRKVLSRFGAYVRTRARSSLRKRTAASAPGTPPSVHSGEIKKFLYFVFEPASKGVVIGPAGFGRARPGGKTVPELHEEGGAAVEAARAVFLIRRPGGAYVRSPTQRGFRVDIPAKLARYPARPYMKPAFDAELKGKLAGLLTDFVTGGPT